MASQDKFEKLRNMEAFSNEMLNRIIAFQEKEHAAWREDLPFEQRIRDLPLHYLVFSAGDRDPVKFSHTICPYYPLRREMRRIRDFAMQTSQAPVVYDLYPGNGFLGSLLAREGVHVTGLMRSGAKPNQISSFYDPQCYRKTELSQEQWPQQMDVVYCSWTPPNADDAKLLLQRKPKLIVCVFSDHQNDQGEPQTGNPTQIGARSPEYTLIDQWSITRPQDIFHAIWPDLTPSPEEVRHTQIFARSDLQFDIPVWHEDLLYDWENELSMALLAHEAQQFLRRRGVNL